MMIPMAESLLVKNSHPELKNTASYIIESKLFAILRKNFDSDIPLDKGSAIKILCDKFRFTEADARQILLALDKEGRLRFGKSKVSLNQEGVNGDSKAVSG